MSVRVGAIQTLATSETDKVSLNIYFQGCKRRCKGCHNPEFWDEKGGREFSYFELFEIMEQQKPYHDALVFLGGEPLLQIDAVEVLAEYGKALGYELWLFTGYELHKIPPSILGLFDYIKAGPYVEELKTEGFPASSNQILVRRDNDEGYIQHLP